MRSTWFPGIAIGLWLCGTFVLGKMAQPPAVTFPAPRLVVQEFVTPASGSEQELRNTLSKWSVSCLRADTASHVIRPNWENPNCRLPK